MQDRSGELHFVDIGKDGNGWRLATYNIHLKAALSLDSFLLLERLGLQSAMNNIPTILHEMDLFE